MSETIIQSKAPSARSAVGRPARRLALVVPAAFAALALGTVLRALVNAEEAFWFDEVWTATIALQDWKGALDMLRSDIIAPFYYVCIWVWSKFFGLSNFALRAPGMILAIAAPALAWLMLRRLLGLRELALFTVLIALWIPGLYYAQEARSYAFVFFGAVLQTVFFFRAVQGKGDRRDIAGWAAAGLFLGLTHYTTIFLSAVEGLALLALFWRTRLLALTAAGLAYAPVFLAIFLHGDTISQYADDEHFWLKPLAVRDLARAAAFLAGDKLLVPVLGALIAASAIADWRSAGRESAERSTLLRYAGLWRARLGEGIASPLFVTGCASALALVLFLCVSAFRPMFLPRYLIPFAPGLFMLLVWLLVAMPACRRWADGALAGLYFIAASIWAGISIHHVDRGLSWELESEHLARSGVSEILFFLDQGFPIPYREDIQSNVYSFYLARDAVDARARSFSPDFATYGDPRPALARFLTEKPGRGIIWTLSPGPLGEPIPTDRAARIELIRARGFSAVYDHSALSELGGVTCRTTGASWYPKYVCYSK